MGTIPVPPTIVAGTAPPASTLNQYKTVLDFWALTPRCWAYPSSSVSLSNGVDTVLAIGAEVYDIPVFAADNELHPSGSSRIYIKTPGKYRVTGQVVFVPNATGSRAARVLLNAAGNPAAGTELALTTQAAVSGNSTSVPVLVPAYPFAVGDYVELFASQNSGGSLSTNVNGVGRTYLAIEMVAA